MLGGYVSRRTALEFPCTRIFHQWHLKSMSGFGSSKKPESSLRLTVKPCKEWWGGGAVSTIAIDLLRRADALRRSPRAGRLAVRTSSRRSFSSPLPASSTSHSLLGRADHPLLSTSLNGLHCQLETCDFSKEGVEDTRNPTLHSLQLLL